MKKICISGVLLLMINCIHIPKTTAYNPDLKSMEIEGYRFHIRTAGSKNLPPLVVIHGGPGNDFQYLLPLEKLSDRFHVLFYDQRMTGLSPRKSNVEPGPEQDIADLHNIIQQFAGGQKVILLGHSYGAMLAAGYITRHPDAVSKAVVMEPGILTRETAREFIARMQKNSSFFQKLRVVPLLLKSLFVKVLDGEERMDYIVTEMSGKGKGQPYQCDGVSLPQGSFVRAGYTVLKKTVIPMIDNPDLFTVDLVSGLERFQGQILLLSSSCSFIGYDYQEKYHRQYFPHATRHVKLDNTGHNFITTDTEMSLAAIRKFLTE